MKRGYIKLWRKAMDAGWIKNHKLWAFWTWCLLKATHEEYDAIVGLQTVHLLPGQFVTGREIGSAETGLTVQEYRTIMSFLKKAGNITIKSTNRYSIVSIVNWETYQASKNDINQPNNQQVTNNQPAPNHIQTHENKKNEKKKDNSNTDFILPDWLPKEQWADFLEMRVKIRKPLTEKAKLLAINKLKELAETGNDPGDVLNQSTLSAWLGLFPLKDSGHYSGAGKAAQKTVKAKSDGQPYPCDFEG
jgi:hypothetical protein